MEGNAHYARPLHNKGSSVSLLELDTSEMLWLSWLTQLNGFVSERLANRAFKDNGLVFDQEKYHTRLNDKLDFIHSNLVQLHEGGETNFEERDLVFGHDTHHTQLIDKLDFAGSNSAQVHEYKEGSEINKGYHLRKTISQPLSWLFPLENKKRGIVVYAYQGKYFVGNTKDKEEFLFERIGYTPTVYLIKFLTSLSSLTENELAYGLHKKQRGESTVVKQVSRLRKVLENIDLGPVIQSGNTFTLY